MGRLLTLEALVLRVYDTGNADRFCILLTDRKGRIPVCAKGVRKPQSKWGSALQSFQRLRIDLEEHRSLSGRTHFYLRSASCLSSYDPLRRDIRKFLLASLGTELLLHFLEDEHRDEAVFMLVREYFQCVAHTSQSLLLPTFQLSLLSLLGFLPSFVGEHAPPSTRLCSRELHAYLSSRAPLPERVKMPLSSTDQEMLWELSTELLQDHLSFPLRSSIVADALWDEECSPSTPISAKFGRASYWEKNGSERSSPLRSAV